MSLSSEAGFWRGDRGRFLSAFLGDIIDVMEPIIAWENVLLTGSLSIGPQDMGLSQIDLTQIKLYFSSILLDTKIISDNALGFSDQNRL